MQIDFLRAGLFIAMATGLLGSPGPGISALVSLGRSRGFVRSMPFFWGLQLGLDVAAAGCAVGLFSLVRTIPGAVTTLAVIGTTYLVWLAYRIATAPVRGSSGARKNEPAFTAAGGFLLGVTNPKAYLAFVSLMSSQVVVRSNASADVFFKWLAIAVVIVVVDMVWLWIGAVLGRSDMGPRGERTLNVAMGSVILGSSILAWV